MEFSIFVPLMVAAIQSAGQVLASFASKAKGVASNYIFDKEFVNSTITDSVEKLSELVNATTSDLKEEMREQSIVDVVQELQAHTISIGKLLSLVKTSEITPAMAERLITGGLLPLQVSLEKAELRLKHYGKDDLSLYCHIIGTSTLIAGYAYAGQNVYTLQKDLENSVYIFQKRLLNLIAPIIIQNNREIPWDKIPRLLTTDGVLDLLELYNSTFQSVGKGDLLRTHTTANQPELKLKTPSTINNENVEENTGAARKMPSFLANAFYCSECGCSMGVNRDTLVCPGCKKTFAEKIG